jgi:hypothetical protein
MPEVEGLESGKMTVGRHLIADCKGENTEGFDFSKAAVKPEAKYFLKIFSVQPESSGSFKMDFTLYLAGEKNLSEFPLTDGTNEIVLNAPPVKVESVLKPTEDGKPQEPFGPMFPISIAVPYSYYLFALGLVAVLVIYLIVKGRRLHYYRKLKAKLVEHHSPVDPEAQFYRAVRSAEKQGYPLPDLEKAFRLYSLRSYQLPLFDLSNDRVIRYFRRNYPEHKDARIQLQKLLGEFEVLNQAQTVDEERKSQLVKKLYKFVDHYKGLSHE